MSAAPANHAYIRPWFALDEDKDNLVNLLNLHELVFDTGAVARARRAEFVTRKLGVERYLFRTAVLTMDGDAIIAASYYGQGNRLGHLRQLVIDATGQPYLIMPEKEKALCTRRMKYVKHLVELESAGEIPGLPNTIIRRGQEWR